jgi:hypothetical protein
MAEPEKILTMPKYDLSVYPNLLKAAELLDESNYTQGQSLNPLTLLQYFKTLHPLE